MNKPKFTPGPWVRSNKTMGHIHATDGDNHIVRVATVGDFGDKELVRFNRGRWSADARLISAAPELYDACAAMIENIDAWLETGKPASKEESGRLYEAMVEALKKARGEK